MMNPDEYGGTIPVSSSTPGVGLGGAITGLVSLGAGMYDSYQNRKVSRENTDKTLRAQKEEAELAYQRSVEMWNMQNAYNSPQAQMARFKEAGLNPHLMYGQGNAGNASSAPSYQPPAQQYRYQAGNYGAALQSAIPVLMQVGTWMQDMRLKEVALKKGSESIETSNLQQDQLAQIIDYLAKKNPRMLEEIDNRLSLFPYQQQAQQYLTHQGYLKVQDLEQDYRYKYGEDLFHELLPGPTDGTGSYRGTAQTGARRLQFLRDQSKLRLQGYDEKLKEAQSSWSDMDITNPQALIQMVLGGVMGLAGQTLRLSTRPGRSRTGQAQQQKMRNTSTQERMYKLSNGDYEKIKHTHYFD